jgi:hypothetical protein
MAQIGLGDRVKDKITKLKGIVVARTEWLYGCIRITVQPEEIKDGKACENFCVDEAQLDLVRAGVIKGEPIQKKKSPAGNRDDKIAISR